MLSGVPMTATQNGTPSTLVPDWNSLMPTRRPVVPGFALMAAATACM